MNKHLLQSYNIYLNTANRDVDYYNFISSGTPNYLAYAGWYLKKMISKTSKNSYFTLSVKNVIIPFTFNNIGSFNKTFQIIYNSITYNIIVDEGNPNIQQLIDDIKTKILSAIPSLVGLFTILYNSYDNTITFNNQSVLTIDFLFTNNYIGKSLGFLTNAQCLPNSSLKSQITINVNQLQNVYIRSDNLTFTNSYESIVSKNNISDIISIIPILVSSGNYIVFQDSSNFETRLGDDKIDFIRLYLTSGIDDDHLLNLYLDWTIHLQINEYSIEQNNNINFNPSQNNLTLSNKDNIPTQEEEYLKKRKIDLENEIKEITLRKNIRNKN
ncbi:MAG: hypothetical protein MUP09_00260 [Thiovulaceae bacterium]|nr:hypothetical protein [Sulfurimonadaceae bacterium]